MSDELAHEILGALIMRPALLEVCDLRDLDLPAGRLRRTFSAISSLWEESKPPNIDPVILAERVGGDSAVTFIASLMDGTIKLDEPTFHGRVAELRKRALKSKIETRAKSGQLDLDELRADLGAYDRLGQVGAADSPPAMVSLSEVDPQSVEWLWPNFIPLGKACMISGDPNVGKTWLALDVAARLSRGLAWPDGAPGPEAANSVYLSVEDNPADTLRPRIDSLGGDPSKISIINPACSDFISFADQGGIKKLEQQILKIENVRLVVLDPVLDFSGGINPNAAEQVRAFLTPLIRLAEKLNFALILIAHLNKAQSQSAIYRTGGSTSAWLGKCRAAFMIFRDSEEKKKRYVSAIKSNLAQDDPPQLSFVPDSGRLVFEKVVDEVSVDEQLNPQLRERGEKEDSSFTATWLKEALKDGPLNAKEIKQAGRDCGLSDRALNRAAHKLNLVMKAEGFGKFKSSVWSLREKDAQ